MSAGDEFVRLVRIMRRLRTDCPWDRSQSHDTLRPHLLEETYEVLHALDEGRYAHLREELGDLMLQIVFHAEIAEDEGRFDVADVLRGINEKLIRRHPHVFGDKEAKTPDDVIRRWESIKAEQEQQPSSLAGVPAELPALARAVRVLSTLRQAGLDPYRGRDALADAETWLAALARSVEEGDRGGAGNAAGMLCLAVARLAGAVGASPEDGLRESLGRLSAAFRREEERLKAEGRTLADLADDELGAVAARLLAQTRGEADE